MTTEGVAMNWNKEGIMRWLYMHDIYAARTPSQQKWLEDAFIREAKKHQDTAMDRKLYRGALKIVEAGGLRATERAIQSFMQIGTRSVKRKKKK